MPPKNLSLSLFSQALSTQASPWFLYGFRCAYAAVAAIAVVVVAACCLLLRLLIAVVADCCCCHYLTGLDRKLR
jgi:hypothetical protein